LLITYKEKERKWKEKAPLKEVGCKFGYTYLLDLVFWRIAKAKNQLVQMDMLRSNLLNRSRSNQKPGTKCHTQGK